MALSPSRWRAIFSTGDGFFFLLFLALSFDTHSQLPKRDMRANITPQIAEGKKLWEVNDCIGCHTLMGEGAYFAPELGNVVARYGDEASRPSSRVVRRKASRAAAACPSSTSPTSNWTPSWLSCGTSIRSTTPTGRPTSRADREEN